MVNVATGPEGKADVTVPKEVDKVVLKLVIGAAVGAGYRGDISRADVDDV
jgi:hypothetical protein